MAVQGMNLQKALSGSPLKNPDMLINWIRNNISDRWPRNWLLTSWGMSNLRFLCKCPCLNKLLKITSRYPGTGEWLGFRWQFTTVGMFSIFLCTWRGKLLVSWSRRASEGSRRQFQRRLKLGQQRQCVCVCLCEREREREAGIQKYISDSGSGSFLPSACVY